ncbi:MAG: CoA pyrophosphatase [Moraxellaceae bacterium]|nr:CoA pyrophosphatase [Moraxellaceae bacterium]
MNPQITQLKERLSPTLADIDNTEIADASILIAITDEESPKLLLTRRASHLNSHAGEVAFAGGKYEPNDKNNIATALRETFEETNLPPSQVQIIGQLQSQKSKSGLSVRPIVAIIPPQKNLIAEESEIARIFWVELAWLLATPTVDYQVTTKVFGEKVTLSTPSWQIDNEIIWGLTGRIIGDLLKVGFDKKVEHYFRLVE